MSVSTTVPRAEVNRCDEKLTVRRTGLNVLHHASFWIRHEESGIVPFLHDDERDLRQRMIHVECSARILQGSNFVVQDFLEVSIIHT